MLARDNRLPSSISSYGGPFPAEYIVERVTVPPPERCPEVYLILGPCRTGTTAVFFGLSRLMRSYYQPLKGILRTGTGELSIREEDERISIKETFGPYHHAECVFNPAELLLAAGVPEKKLRVGFVFREPVAAFDSWLENFAGTNVDLFVAAYKSSLNYVAKCRERGLRTAILSYDSLENDRDESIARWTEQLELPHCSELTDWRAPPVAGEAVINVKPTYQDKELQAQVDHRFFGRVKEHQGIIFQPRPIVNVTFEDRIRIERDIRPLYERVLADNSTFAEVRADPFSILTFPPHSPSHV